MFNLQFFVVASVEMCSLFGKLYLYNTYMGSSSLSVLQVEGSCLVCLTCQVGLDGRSQRIRSFGRLEYQEHCSTIFSSLVHRSALKFLSWGQHSA